MGSSSTSFEVLGITKERALQALATYRFLTAEQMRRVGVSSDIGHTRQTLRILSEMRPAQIYTIKFGVLSGHGRLAWLHALTPSGVKTLQAYGLGEDVKAHKHTPMIKSDYHHRVACVDFHIALRKWASVDFFHADYDPTGDPLRKRTTIQYPGGKIIPDAILSMTDGATRLCAFEMYMDHRPERPVAQLRQYLPALTKRAIEGSYQYPHSVRVLAVFNDEAVIPRVARLAEKDPALMGALPYFFLGTLESTRVGWSHFDGSSASLY